MRLGLIGLGRIGAFHATTLTSLDAVDSLVVYDAGPGPGRRGRPASRRRAGAERRGAAGRGHRRRGDRRGDRRASRADPGLRWRPGLPTFCEKPVSKDPATASRSCDATQSGPASRCRSAIRAGSTPRSPRPAGPSPPASSAGCTRSARPPWTRRPPPDGYVKASGGIFRDCSVHDFDAVRYVTGQEVVEVYATGCNQGDAFFAENDDVDTAADRCSPSTSGALAVVSNSRYNARGYDVRLELHGSTDSVAAGLEPTVADPLRPNPASTFPGGHAAHLLHGPVRRRVPRRAGRVHRRGRRHDRQSRARSPTRSRSAGSPRRPPCRCRSTARSAWTRSVTRRRR